MHTGLSVYVFDSVFWVHWFRYFWVEALVAKSNVNITHQNSDDTTKYTNEKIKKHKLALKIQFF